MTASELSDQDWRIRLFMYRYFVAHERPPTHAEMARQLDIPAADARRVYHRLHEHHALLLAPGTDRILMANPLSAAPTSYRVHADGRQLWANCAWDSLGIPAMLHTNARIKAAYAHSGEKAIYAITAGALQGDGGCVHFPLPFRRWYDDLVHT